MNLLVPNKIMAADGEVTIRQYRCAKLKSEISDFYANATVAVTNKRLILFAERKPGRKAIMLQHEVYIDNIAGVSFFTGRPPKKKGLFKAFGLLFLLLGLLAGLAYWQAQAIYNVLQVTSEFGSFQTMVTAAPMGLFLLILIIKAIIPKKYTLSFTIHSKSYGNSNVRLHGASEATNLTDNFYVRPYHKETKRMFSELSSIILDIQKHGADKVIDMLATEEEASAA